MRPVDKIPMSVNHRPGNAALHNPVLCLVLITFIAFSACSGNKKEQERRNKELYEDFLATKEFLATLEESNTVSRPPLLKEDISPFADVDLYAVVKKDNVNIYFEPDPDSTIIGDLNRGSVVNFARKNPNPAVIEGNFEYFYSREKIGGDWMFGADVEFIEQNETAKTMLSNSKTVNAAGFPVQIAHETEYTGDIGFPYYLDDTGDLVVFDGSWAWFGTHGLTIHLRDLPESFVIVQGGGSYSRKYPAEKRSSLVAIEDYFDFFDDKDKAVLEKINPIYNVRFPALLSSVPMDLNTEIQTETGKVIFSADIMYPARPFENCTIEDGHYLLRYSTKLPVYLAIYETDITAWERNPVCAFLVTPDDGIWEGILNLGPEFKKDREYRIYLYRFDETNPADYTKLELLNGYWNNIIDF